MKWMLSQEAVRFWRDTTSILRKACVPSVAANVGSTSSDGESGGVAMMNSKSIELGECPICCLDMKMSDVQFPLHCPSAGCDFNLCNNCIIGMQRSEADGYEEASDGSRQVKFHIACPSCRSRYVAPEHDFVGEEKKESPIFTKSSRSSQPIVGYVVLLREAVDALNLLRKSDCELSAAELQHKSAFVSQTTVEDIREAVLNYEIYVKQIHKSQTIYKFDWNDFASLPTNVSGASGLEARKNVIKARTWRDPTLFMGLEELMSVEEQNFVTQLMCSGDSNNLVQAAHIMHGVLNNLGTERPNALVVQENSGFGVRLSPLPPSPRRIRPPPPLDPKVASKLKKRFPLPSHMPCCFVLPVYDPNDLGNLPLRFETKSQASASPLQLATVRGVAGRSGLRRGDIITHIHAEPMKSYEQYFETVAHMYADNPNDDLMIVVNASPEVAQALQQRARNMQQAKISF